VVVRLVDEQKRRIEQSDIRDDLKNL